MNMNCHEPGVRPLRSHPRSLRPAAALGFLLGACFAAGLATAQSDLHADTAWIRTTNYVPRFITNVVKVSIPTNTFYDEYHTNWIQQKITNVVDIYRTNLTTEFRTNVIPVDEFRTNIQAAYTTNLKTISLTNWETVLVMKTNWVTQPVTNVVEIEMPAPQPGPAAAAAASPSTEPEPAPKPESSPVAAAPAPATGMGFELTHTGKPLKAGDYPIRLILKSAEAADEILPVQEWRVEKADGGALLVGSRPEFSGTLRLGSYRVTARLRGSDNVLRSFRCQVDVKADASAERSPALPASR